MSNPSYYECLKCDSWFYSKNQGNRFCPKCSNKSYKRIYNQVPGSKSRHKLPGGFVEEVG